ncbi:MAG: AmmeMemoRadiSam system protein B [Calditrichaeota bacterium]|nr:AmmeMemoRadiSam system protein B [Calditrichota bacterium]
MTVQVREPAVAGMFYPADVEELTTMIDAYLSESRQVVDGEIGGLIAPHAGYIYSGPVAAWAFKQIEGKTYPYVVVIAPSHFEYFQGASVFPGQSYETPLGSIPVATELVDQLVAQNPRLRKSDEGHRLLGGGRGEHALEVELPFLQRVLKNFQLIPIVMAEQDWPTAEALAQAIATVFRDRKVLVVASSDLSHYYPYETAYRLDEKMVHLVETFAYDQILDQVAAREVEACGAGPIVATMYACKLMGYPNAKVLKYATSGDVPYGEKSQVVGYMAGVLYR